MLMFFIGVEFITKYKEITKIIVLNKYNLILFTNIEIQKQQSSLQLSTSSMGKGS